MAKKKENKSTKKNEATPSKEWMAEAKEFKPSFFAGLILLAFGGYLLLALGSFLFTGAADKSLFDLGLWELLTNTELEAFNRTGKLGAWLADILITHGVGITALLLPFFLFIIGFRLMGARVLPMRKTIWHTFVIIVWLSIALGFTFFWASDEFYFLLGGYHGYYVSKWLMSIIGIIGTALLLIITLLIYLSANITGFQAKLQNLILKPIRKKTSEKAVVAAAAPKALEDDDVFADEPELPAAQTIPPVVTTPVTQVFAPDDSSFTFTRKIDIPENEIPTEDLNLDIAQGFDEEEAEEFDQMPMGDYDPTLDLSSYQLPSLDLLDDHKNESSDVSEAELLANKNKIVKTLEDFKIQIQSIKATVGPTVTLYEIVPAPGVKISRIQNLENDIALSLAALGIRIIAPIPGQGTIGIEVPNSEPKVVSMRSILASKKFQTSPYELPIALGKTISNETFVIDLAKAPHMLVAGATGQGKSVGLNAIITSLLYKKHPSQLKFVMVDPKKVELNIYSKIERHFLAKLPDEEDAIITDVQKVVNTLNSLTIEMDERYDLLKKAHARNIKEYNQKFVKRQLNPEKGHRFLPYIVVVIDEFADLIMTAGKEVELPIARIAQLARAVGIHMIIATQRPSTNIITGVIKANFPTRVAFKVASMIDSRTILDSPGANQLIGRGDMLISQGSDLIRVQCAFVDTPEVEKVNDYIGNQKGYASAFLLPAYVGAEGGGNEPGDVDLSKKDPMFDDAARIVVSNQSGSTSLVQRRFSIGYNRAGRIIDQLEAAGIVGPFEGSKARAVLVSDEAELERILNNYR
ncbi:MAG: DNA translocase FtsK 4TM domain-containing protein [Breznakibacter sp.]